MHFFDSPPRSTSSWNDVESSSFVVAGGDALVELLELATEWKKPKSSLRLERFLLVVEGVRHLIRNPENRSETKKLFAKERAKLIFHDWSCAAVKLIRMNNNRSNNSTAVYLLTAILKLVVDCKFVKTQKQVEALKSRGVDWEKLIIEVRYFWWIVYFVYVQFDHSKAHILRLR